jgi:hypothetical protein
MLFPLMRTHPATLWADAPPAMKIISQQPRSAKRWDRSPSPFGAEMTDLILYDCSRVIAITQTINKARREHYG